jgi:hypothetical protein
MRTCAVGVALLMAFVAGASVAQTPLDVPMDRSLVSVLIVFGVQDKEPTVWEGTYEVTGGQIVATDGWRFLGDDYATTSAFKFENHRRYPLMWARQNRDPNTFPAEPNGIILTLADVGPDSLLQLHTTQGDFSIPVGSLEYGAPKRTGEGRIEYQRVPTHREIVKAPTEDGYPAAAALPNGGLCVAYVAFTHGKGFETRPPIKEMPTDFASLAEPTGGEQLMFTEMVGGQWSQPIPLTEPGGDLFKPAIALDGQGRVWVLWSANVDGNWDLYARVRSDGKWLDTQRVTTAPGSDFDAAAATDAQGRVWLAWQSLGGKGSDIYGARQDGDSLGKPVAIAAGDANEWSPAIAASADGRVAVAWDTYARGSYDVAVKEWREGKWGDERLVAGTLQNECRASVAFDRRNRLWIAYEVSPEGWGKDFGPYDRSPQKTALYQSRQLGVKVVADGSLYAPETDVNLTLPMPDGTRRFPKSQPRFLAGTPRIVVAADGRVWLSARMRMSHFDNPVGGCWMNFLSTLDPEGWRTSFIVPGTDGFLHEANALVPAPDSGLYVVSVSDGCFRAAPAMGPQPWKRRQRSAGAPPATTRTYVEYPDWQFNEEISVADTGPVPPPSGDLQLVAAQPEQPAGPSEAAREETEQLAAIHAYRADVGGKQERIWRGEFHRHTEISPDGQGDGSLFDMWRYGVDMARLDWIGCGDHDNGSGREFTWWITQKTTSLFNMPRLFTPVYSYERSVNYPDGHRNVVFPQRGVRPLARLQGGFGKNMDDQGPDAERPSTPDTQMLYRYLVQLGGVCASHTSGTDMGTDWRDNDPNVEPVVEIYQGCRNSYERPGAPRAMSENYALGGYRPFGFVSRALLKGYRLGFQSSSDHISTHMSYCNVWVEDPSQETVVEGMKQRHVYGATDNIIADVSCGEHFMGDEFTVTKPPVIHVKLIGTAPFAEVVVCKDDVYVYSTQPNSNTVEFEWADNDLEPGKSSYYYIRGTQVGQSETKTAKGPTGQNVDVETNNGEVVWVSPMWIKYQPA